MTNHFDITVNSSVLNSNCVAAEAFADWINGLDDSDLGISYTASVSEDEPHTVNGEACTSSDRAASLFVTLYTQWKYQQ